MHFKDQFRKHTDKLIKLVADGKLVSQVDAKQFVGLEQVADAIDWMYGGKNVGKVVVTVAPSAPAASKL
jgi:NADPH-dependent curcumin reductase CurA